MGDFGDIGKSRQFVSIIYYLKLIFWQMNGTVIKKVTGKIFYYKKSKHFFSTIWGRMNEEAI